MLFSQQILELIRNGIGETLCMVIISTIVSYIIGIPLGIILVVTDKEGIRPIPALQKVLGLIINLLRSVPFLILLIMMIPGLVGCVVRNCYLCAVCQCIQGCGLACVNTKRLVVDLACAY